MCRLVPLLLPMRVPAFPDRANVGFARESFQADTGPGNAARALGAGVFRPGHVAPETPGNLLLHRYGTRPRTARITTARGLVPAAMTLAHTATAFSVLRFLPGAAEAGSFPGTTHFPTPWMPSSRRGRVMSLPCFGAPLALVLGGPFPGLPLEVGGVVTPAIRAGADGLTGPSTAGFHLIAGVAPAGAAPLPGPQLRQRRGRMPAPARHAKPSDTKGTVRCAHSC